MPIVSVICKGVQKALPKFESVSQLWQFRHSSLALGPHVLRVRARVRGLPGSLARGVARGVARSVRRPGRLLRRLGLGLAKLEKIFN